MIKKTVEFVQDITREKQTGALMPARHWPGIALMFPDSSCKTGKMRGGGGTENQTVQFVVLLSIGQEAQLPW